MLLLPFVQTLPVLPISNMLTLSCGPYMTLHCIFSQHLYDHQTNGLATDKHIYIYSHTIPFFQFLRLSVLIIGLFIPIPLRCFSVVKVRIEPGSLSMCRLILPNHIHPTTNTTKTDHMITVTLLLVVET